MKKSQKISLLIRALIQHNQSLWLELKRQIFDQGYQSHYPYQSNYEQILAQRLGIMSDSERQIMMGELRIVAPLLEWANDKEFEQAFQHFVVGTIVSRARTAGARTINW